MNVSQFLPPHSPESKAHRDLHIDEYETCWDEGGPITEALVAGFASYSALERFLSGSDLYLIPRTRSELESILRRYSYDAIHNAISRSRSALQTGGYSRVCHLAEQSISDVLDTGNNIRILLDMHRPPQSHEQPEPRSTRCHI
ncbi:hypothetical protein C8J56DRAFT_934483 [Mycena floridula]|nr:hypothetical protein C8J56DRAFT_934483 [Mycena floridula]